MQPRVPLELGKLEGVEVVADELVNDVLHKRFKMILTRDLLLSVLMQMERLLRNIANMFGSSYRSLSRNEWSLGGHISACVKALVIQLRTSHLG